MEKDVINSCTKIDLGIWYKGDQAHEYQISVIKGIRVESYSSVGGGRTTSESD